MKVNLIGNAVLAIVVSLPAALGFFYHPLKCSTIDRHFPPNKFSNHNGALKMTSEPSRIDDSSKEGPVIDSSMSTELTEEINDSLPPKNKSSGFDFSNLITWVLQAWIAYLFIDTIRIIFFSATTKSPQ